MYYRRKLIKAARSLSVVLIVSMFNLNMIVPGHAPEGHSSVCGCYTEHGRCSTMHLCDCCKEKLVYAEQEEKACHQSAAKHSGHKKHKNMEKASADTISICRLGCSKSQYGFVMPPIDPRILTKSPTVEPGMFFSVCKTFPVQKPLTPYVDPPEKPPRFTT